MDNSYNQIINRTVCIGAISQQCPVIGPDATGEEVMALFQGDEPVQGFPVITEGKVMGLIMKESFLSRLATQYGMSIYMKRPIKIMLEDKPLIVDYNTPFHSVAISAANRQDSKLYDYIIVTREDSYFGIVTIKDLLQESAKIEVNAASHMNPFSGLPGKEMTDRYLSKLIAANTGYSVIHLNLNNYDRYAVTYGMEAAESVIILFARLVRRCIESLYDENGFVGHLYKDEFIVAVKSYGTDIFHQELSRSFVDMSRSFYGKNSEAAGNDSSNTDTPAPSCNDSLLSISYVAISNEKSTYTDKYQIYNKLAKKKLFERKTSACA